MDPKIASGKDDDITLPGFRFHPTDEELIGYYLKRKIQRLPLPLELIKQLDIYKFDPWDLPKLSVYGEREWYFYCPRGRKYRNSTRPNRVAVAGYWKATGIDKPIYSSNATECIGLKKSLVFYRGRAAAGVKTDWMMHEFRLPSTKMADKSPPLADSWAICRIFKKTRSPTQIASYDSQQSFFPTSNIEHPSSKTAKFCSSVGGISDGFMFAPLEASHAPDCTVDTGSMLSSQFLLDPSEAIDQIIDSKWPPTLQSNGFSDSFTEKVRETSEVGGDEGGFRKNTDAILVDNNQWEAVRSIGFPFSLQSNDAWKPSFPFDLTKFC